MRLASVLSLSLACCAAPLLSACTCPCAESKPPAAAIAPPSAEPLSARAAGSVSAVKTCGHGFITPANGLVDDAEDNDNHVAVIEGRGGYWWTAHDDKGSTIEPSGTLKMSEGGANGSKYAVHVTGKTAAQEDKAWGSIVGLRLADHGLYDASKYAGISFFAKTSEKSGSQVRLKVADVNSHPDGNVCKEGCYNDFGKDFNFSHDWQEYRVSFAEMKQQEGWGDPRPAAITSSQLVQIAWHLMTPGAEFDLWIDDVRLLDCQ